MYLQEMNMQNKLVEKSHSLFDFGSIASKYDRWYDTKEGRLYDSEEKSTILGIMPHAKPGDCLLDVGCGTGHWSRFFALLGFEVIGIDISSEMIEVAHSHNSPGCQFEIADVYSLPYDDNSFDIVTAIAMLEFLPDTKAALAEMIRCTKPHGKLIIGSLNKWAPINQHRISECKEPYISANMFSPVEIDNLFTPYGRVRLQVSTHDLNDKWIKPLLAIRDSFFNGWDQPKGAFIVAEVSL